MKRFTTFLPSHYLRHVILVDAKGGVGRKVVIACHRWIPLLSASSMKISSAIVSEFSQTFFSVVDCDKWKAFVTTL